MKRFSVKIFKRTGNVRGFGVILLGRCRACRMYGDIFYPRILNRRCLLILMSRNTHASYLFTGFTYCFATCRIASMFALIHIYINSYFITYCFFLYYFIDYFFYLAAQMAENLSLTVLYEQSW